MTINVDGLAYGAPLRIYYNKTENPLEVACVDFGPGTPVVLGSGVRLGPPLVSETVLGEHDADPRFWLSVAGVTAVYINLPGSCIYLVGEQDLGPEGLAGSTSKDSRGAGVGRSSAAADGAGGVTVRALAVAGRGVGRRGRKRRANTADDLRFPLVAERSR